MENIQVKPAKKLEVGIVEDLLKDPNKVVIVQTAPSVRVALGEMFGAKPGTSVTGKMVAALRQLGFKYVFDTDFGADITVWEEAMEFLKRLKGEGGPLPQFNSCCIGWLATAERTYKDLFSHISTVKSPIGCLGSIAKTYFAEKMNINPNNIVVVAVVPCILKKNENALPYNKTNFIYDVDYCWTTKDLGALIKDNNIDFMSLVDSEFDNPLGESTSSGTIFGRSGGVLEAVLRCAIYWDSHTVYTNPIVFTPSSISPDILETEITIANRKVKVCHTGMVGVRKLVEMIRNNECPYDFIEVMSCPGGCIMGAGQPMHLPSEGITPLEVRKARISGLNDIADKQDRKISPLNQSIMKIYDAMFDGTAGSEKAELNLHRKY